MAKIISILLVSIIGWVFTGYDFFILFPISSIVIEIYKSISLLERKTLKNTKDKTARS